MKFTNLVLRDRLDKYAHLRGNDSSFTAERGWTIEDAPDGFLLRHEGALRPLYLPAAAVSYAEVLVELPAVSDEKRGPGRPRAS